MADLASVSGRMESQLDEDGGSAGGNGPAQVTLAVRTVSGNQRIRRATPA